MNKTILAIACILIAASAMHVNLNHEEEGFREGKVTIQADNGKYLTRCNNCGASRYADSASLHIQDQNSPFAVWNVIQVGDKFAFQAQNGNYLSICTDCWYRPSEEYNDAVFVHAKLPVPNALWFAIPLQNGKWVFEGNNKQYLNRCNKCVQDGAYEDSVFAQVKNPEELQIAQWTVNWL